MRLRRASPQPASLFCFASIWFQPPPPLHCSHYYVISPSFSLHTPDFQWLLALHSFLPAEGQRAFAILALRLPQRPAAPEWLQFRLRVRRSWPSIFTDCFQDWPQAISDYFSAALLIATAEAFTYDCITSDELARHISVSPMLSARGHCHIFFQFSLPRFMTVSSTDVSSGIFRHIFHIGPAWRLLWGFCFSSAFSFFRLLASLR